MVFLPMWNGKKVERYVGLFAGNRASNDSWKAVRSLLIRSIACCRWTCEKRIPC
jgi:hypothetical protein